MPETQFFEGDSAFHALGLTRTQRLYGFAAWYVVVVVVLLRFVISGFYRSLLLLVQAKPSYLTKRLLHFQLYRRTGPQRPWNRDAHRWQLGLFRGCVSLPGLFCVLGLLVFRILTPLPCSVLPP
jgi:hypothetical protein